MKEDMDNILYIDDEKENLTGFKYVFKRHFNVYTASSAKEGLKILSEENIKVLLTDQRMPEFTGVQLLEEVAIKHPEVYRIIITGYTDVQDIIAAINKGKVFQFIRKPWDKDEVKVVIDNAIKLYNLQQENKFLIQSLEESNVKQVEINAKLEDTVKHRTLEIKEQNIELEKHRNHLEELVKQRTLELELAKERAEEGDKLKTAFLANVSHEIRTPMNAIVGFSELLLADDINPQNKNEFKEQIVLNSNSLLRLIDDIIDISRIEANQIIINYGEHDLNRLLRELMVIFSKEKLEKGREDVDIQLELGSFEEVFIMTDKIRLHQVLSNLIGNALKFTERGQIIFGYKIITSNENEPVLQFYVKDTGIGIPAEAHSYIFDRFRKADLTNNKLFRGTGLGLFICRSIVEKFCGTIWLESEKDNGAKFIFEIPYLPAETKNHTTQELIYRENEDSFDFDGKLILIAEDEDASYTYIEQIMRNTKAKLIRARNGQETLDALKYYGSVDLILMDMQMPVMTGYEAIEKIREKNNVIPIIVQTAYALKTQQEEILETGCEVFLSKPYKSAELLSTIKKCIQ